jgi:hypothetical protein
MLTKFENILLRIREDIVARISPKLRKMRYSELLYSTKKYLKTVFATPEIVQIFSFFHIFNAERFKRVAL